MPSKRPSDEPEENDRKPAAKRVKKEPEDDAESVTQDEPELETVVKPWEDKKDYEAIFRKHIYIGNDGEEHYDVIDMERDAQRAVRRITDHQEIVKQYQKVVRAYNNYMRDHPWITEGLMQDKCRVGDLLIQFPPKMDENWLRYELVGEWQIMGPNWQRMLSCAYTTQLLHSTVEVCWNKYNIYFIWLNLCAESRDK